MPDRKRPRPGPEQTVDFMFERIDAGDFYILCPDNDVREASTSAILWPPETSSRTGALSAGIRITRSLRGIREGK